MRDSSGTIRGGLAGFLVWGWLHVDLLWIAEELRGQGYGSRLLSRAESEAREAGCRHAFLDTFDFQALPFYERHGYTIFGTLDGFPEGHTQYYLRKRIAPSAPPA